MFTFTIVFIERENPLLIKASLPAPGKTLERVHLYLLIRSINIYRGLNRVARHCAR